MKQFAKVLVLTTLIAVGCLMGTKEVKADVGASYTFNTTDGFHYEITGESASSTDAYSVVAKKGSETVSLASGNLEGGVASGDISSSSLLALFTTTEQGKLDYSIRVTVGGTTFDLEGSPISVFVFNPTFDNTKLEITTPTTLPRRSWTDDGIALTVQAKSAPYYVKEIKFTSGGSTTTENVDDLQGAKTCKVSDGTYEIVAGTAHASLTAEQLNPSPAKVKVVWKTESNESIGISYPEDRMEFADDTTSEPKPTYGTVSYSTTEKKETVNYTGSGKFKLKYHAGIYADTEYETEWISFPFGQSVDHVTISPATKTTIVKNANEGYTAKVYLDDTHEATNQKVVWSLGAASTATATITPTTATDTGVTLKATTTGTVRLIATADADSDVSGHIDITVIEASDVADITLPNNGQITQKCTFDLTKDKVTITPSTAASSVKEITYSVADGTYGSFNGTKFTANAKTGSVSITANVKYVDTTKPDKTIFKTITVLPKTVIESDYSTSDKTVKFKLPDAVYIGNENASNIPSVAKYEIAVLDKDGDEAYSKTYSVSDTSKTLSLSSDELEKLVEESGSSLSGDSPKVRLRIKPGGTSQTSSSTVYNNNDNVATTTDEITVYRVSVAEKNHIKGAYLYGLPGREVKITATAESGYKFVSWDDDSSAAATRTVTISTDTSKNSYTATASTTGSSTPKNSSTGGSGNAGANLDKVPKTGEGNTRLLILMVAIISASVAASILLSTLPAKKKIGKEEGVDDKDIFHKKD